MIFIKTQCQFLYKHHMPRITGKVMGVCLSKILVMPQVRHLP